MQKVLTDYEFARLVRETQFGSVRRFRLSDGQPVFDDGTEIGVEYKLSGLEPQREVMDDETYLKRPQVRTMFTRFRQLRNGIVECLDVRDGLPFKMVVRRKAHNSDTESN